MKTLVRLIVLLAILALPAVTCAQTEDTAMHVAEISGYLWFDHLGRPLMRMHVLVHDEANFPLEGALVDVLIWSPDMGPAPYSDYTRQNGYALFRVWSPASGSWTLCVENLTLLGYIYDASQNSVTCMDWIY